MANKIINKARLQEISDLSAQLAEKAGELSSLLSEYNDLVSEAESLCQTVAGEIEEYIDGKSEGWQEGEKGQAWAGLLDAWQSVDFHTVDFDSDLEQGDTLDQLPTDPE